MGSPLSMTPMHHAKIYFPIGICHLDRGFQRADYRSSSQRFYTQIMLNDPQSVKEFTGQRQEKQSESLDRRIAELVANFAPGRIPGWRLDECRSTRTA